MSEENSTPKAKTVKVKIIETRGEASLVEWRDRKGAYRGYVQNDSIDDDRVLEDVLAYALPVGPDPMAINLHTFTERLRLRDVWTKADFVQKRNAVVKSLLEAMEV